MPARVIPRLGDVFREGTLDLQLRNYYFHRDREDNPDSETWAQGGGARFLKSPTRQVAPWLHEVLQFPGLL
jgi:hypothetical protein